MAKKSKDAESIELLAKEINVISKVVRFDCLVLLMYAADAANKFLEGYIGKYGQDQTRINILFLLVTSGGQMTPTNISKRVYRSKHAITRAIDILEKSNLVERKPLEGDRRSINVVITKEGLEFVKQILPDLQRASSVATSCMTKEQVDELGDLSRKLRKWLMESMTNES